MTTLLGVIIGMVLLALAIGQGGGLHVFLNLDALMIVLGGTLASTLISFPLGVFLNFFGLLWKLFGAEGVNQTALVIRRLVELGHKAYQDSVFSLEEEAKTEKNRFVRLGLSLLVRDASPARIARRFAQEMEGVRARHGLGIQMFSFMAKISPAFGLVGTLIGLVNMLRGVGKEISPEVVGPAMAVALVTTLYGALLAFFLFLPASEKLRARSEEELEQLVLVREAVLMMKEGESSRELEEMLFAFLPHRQRKSSLNQIMSKLSS
ncbi:MAG: MotA/TolQ/ExbB proton channel family protein [Deltaproteobacteria bacterium]|nr:MotA/TolQ/ExbB proton channel family protein [Deltaproteobacteria bacterium]